MSDRVKLRLCDTSPRVRKVYRGWRRLGVSRHDANLLTIGAAVAANQGTMRVGRGMKRPGCADECGAFLKSQVETLGIDAHVTYAPPLVTSQYEPLNMRCPHGVLWFMEPTGEQIAAWIRDGVE